MTRANSFSRLLVERLEDRLTPSGNITAFLTPVGSLVLHGDKLSNEISLMQVDQGGQTMVRIQGAAGTTVNNHFGAVFLPSPTRNVRIELQGGNDILNMANFQVPYRLNLYGGIGRDSAMVDELTVSVGEKTNFTSFEFVETNVGGVTLSASLNPIVQQVGTDVMQLKLQQAIATLTKPGVAENVYEQAIGEAMEAIYTSNLVVLPTFNQPDTDDLFNAHVQMAQQAINALTKHVNNAGLGTRQTKADAAEARNFIQVTTEAMEVIGQQTANTNPNNPQSNPILNQDDEGGTFVDNVLTGIFTREVRSPFFLLPKLTSTPDEEVIVTGPIAPDEIVVVVKEFQGLKAVLTPRIVPIWSEPWFARATIVGTTTVWVWEFVPAEFIKTISFTNQDDGAGGREIRVDVQTQLILDRQLLHFWRYIHKNVTAVS